MGTVSDAAPDARSIRTLIDQLALLSDELDGQLDLIARLPDSVMGDRPYEGAQSIRDLYIQFLEREIGVNLSIVEGLVDGSADGQTLEKLVQRVDPENLREARIGEIISRIAGVRREIIDELESAESDSWSRSILADGDPVSLYEWTFAMALRDADDLREIGIQFYERRMAFGIRD